MTDIDVWELCALGVEAKAALTAPEVLVMRADVLLEICGGRLRFLEKSGRSAGQGGRRDGEVVHNADGSKTVAIQSMASLASFLQGGIK